MAPFMTQLETIEEVAGALGDGGAFGPNVEYNTVGELVDALVDLGNTDKVFARHDDHLGLKSDLPIALLNSTLIDAQNPDFESDVEAIIEQANIILLFSKRELSEDDEEEIREDRSSRGENSDD
jgi:hypothetical protein